MMRLNITEPYITYTVYEHSPISTINEFVSKIQDELASITDCLGDASL